MCLKNLIKKKGFSECFCSIYKLMSLIVPWLLLYLSLHLNEFFFIWIDWNNVVAYWKISASYITPSGPLRCWEDCWWVQHDSRRVQSRPAQPEEWPHRFKVRKLAISYPWWSTLVALSTYSIILDINDLVFNTKCIRGFKLSLYELKEKILLQCSDGDNNYSAYCKSTYNYTTNPMKVSADNVCVVSNYIFSKYIWFYYK